MRLLIVLLASVAQLAFAKAVFQTKSGLAFAQAAKEQKLLLIDFSAIWCAPCVAMEATVFETPEFEARTKDLLLLKVDVDLKESWKIKEQYHVFSYPTIILADPQGKEIYRFAGAVDLQGMLKGIELARATKTFDLTRLCGSETEEDLWNCVQLCHQKRRGDCVRDGMKHLQRLVRPTTVLGQEVTAFALATLVPAEDKVAGYEKLLFSSLKNPKALVWIKTYLSLFPSDGKSVPKKALIEKVLTIDPAKIDKISLRNAGMTRATAFRERAQLLEALGRKGPAKTAWKEVAAELEKDATALTSDSQSLPRAFAIDRIEALESAEEAKAALELAEKYRRHYSEEFTFHWATAMLLHDAARDTEALNPAKRGYELAYGDNRIRAGTLLVSILAALHHRDAAKRIYDELNKEYPPSQKLEEHTAYFMKQLEEAWWKGNAAPH